MTNKIIDVMIILLVVVVFFVAINERYATIKPRVIEVEESVSTSPLYIIKSTGEK